MILAAKKLESNKQFKFRNKFVYVDEQLSKENRSLFVKAQEKEWELDHKHGWARSGIINLRKTVNSQTLVTWGGLIGGTVDANSPGKNPVDGTFLIL